MLLSVSSMNYSLKCIMLYIAYKEIISMSREVAFPNWVEFPYKLSTTMFVLIKKLNYRRRKVLFQQYRTNKSFEARDSRE